MHAAVVAAPGHRVDTAGLRAFVTEHKGALYAPAAVHVVDAIPLTPVGKPDKARLRAAAADALNGRPGGPDAPLRHDAPNPSWPGAFVSGGQ